MHGRHYVSDGLILNESSMAWTVFAQNGHISLATFGGSTSPTLFWYFILPIARQAKHFAMKGRRSIGELVRPSVWLTAVQPCATQTCYSSGCNWLQITARQDKMRIHLNTLFLFESWRWLANRSWFFLWFQILAFDPDSTCLQYQQRGLCGVLFGCTGLHEQLIESDDMDPCDIQYD